MFEKFRTLFAKQLRIDEAKITPDAKIQEDLGADSLDILQLLMTLEEEFGVVIPDEELAHFETVRDILTYLESIGLK